MELEVTMGTPDSLEVVSFTAIAISFACEAIMKPTRIEFLCVLVDSERYERSWTYHILVTALAKLATAPPVSFIAMSRLRTCSVPKSLMTTVDFGLAKLD
jgi:hypothetical protein